MLSTRPPRSVKPNTRWRSARRRSHEKSARRIRREHADYLKVMADLATATADDREAIGLPSPTIVPDSHYGTGTGPRAQQAKRDK